MSKEIAYEFIKGGVVFLSVISTVIGSAGLGIYFARKKDEKDGK